MIVLIPVITQFLESHKRLVIPQLGAFIVKEPGRSVLFSDLLKRDDGVLRGLLRDRGMSDLEAAGEIDRLVFEIRHAVERGGEYRLEGFGTLKPGPNGTIAFHYEPRPVRAAAAVSGMPASERRPQTSGIHPAGGGPATDGERPRSAHAAQASSERVAEAVRTAFTEPHVSRSAKMNPDPSVRGLRYGKPPKNTDAYTYVDQAPRRRADRFIWIAVIAAILALGAIAFGLWHDAREQAETEYIELPANQPETGEGAVSDSDAAPAEAR